MRFAPIFILAVAVFSGCGGSRLATGPMSGQALAPGLTLFLRTAPFDPAQYDVVTDETGNIIGTAGCDVWHGSDGGVPEIDIIEGWVIRDGQRLSLDTSCMGTYDSGGGVAPMPVGEFRAEALSEPGTWRISGRFSDGAGTAEVAWQVGLAETTRERLVSGPALFGE